MPIGLLLHPQIHSGCPRVLSVNRDQTPCVSSVAPVLKTVQGNDTFPRKTAWYGEPFLRAKKKSYIFVYLLLPLK